MTATVATAPVAPASPTASTLVGRAAAAARRFQAEAKKTADARLQGTRVQTAIDDVAERVAQSVDTVLDRVGLVRKAKVSPAAVVDAVVVPAADVDANAAAVAVDAAVDAIVADVHAAQTNKSKRR